MSDTKPGFDTQILTPAAQGNGIITAFYVNDDKDSGQKLKDVNVGQRIYPSFNQVIVFAVLKDFTGWIYFTLDKASGNHKAVSTAEFGGGSGGKGLSKGEVEGIVKAAIDSSAEGVQKLVDEAVAKAIADLPPPAPAPATLDNSNSS